MRKRYLIASDIHWCHIEWYGVSTEERMNRFVRHVEEEYKKDPFEALILLGDYSLDHWVWGIKGCYLNEGKSCTKLFCENVLPRLKNIGVKMVMVAGNHEQYGNELWNEITGYKRQDYLVDDNYLFIMPDTYALDLDPTEHSDGTYCNADVDYIKALMDKYPEHKVILCAHHFAVDRPEYESDEFRALVRENERILCMVRGHVHRSNVIITGDEWGNKAVLCTGNYSYNNEANGAATDSMWGFRDIIFEDDVMISRYITPENVIELDGKTIKHPYGYQDEYRLKLK